MKYKNDSNEERALKLREADLLDLPVPTEPLKSWRGMVDPDAVLKFSEQQLERFWSDPEFVRKRTERAVNVPFEL